MREHIHQEGEWHTPTPWGQQPLCLGTYYAKSLQSFPTLWDPRDGSPPGSPVPGILQARTLEWVAISFSNAWKWKVKVKSLNRAWLLATHGLQPTRLLHPWDFPGKNTGVGCHCLLRTRSCLYASSFGCLAISFAVSFNKLKSVSLSSLSYSSK